MQIAYRKLGPTDSKQYREIRLESLKAHPESFGSTFKEQSKLPKLMFEKALEQPIDDRFIIGAFDQKELIGICGVIPLVADNIHDLRAAGALIQMYVRTAYRGRKIGLHLVEATIRNAFRIPDIEQVFLEVKEGNKIAIRVYEQAGFQDYHAEGNETEVSNDSLRMMIIRQDD
jgi:RimJ/RimL family protein N-acetyltransferase